LQEITLSTNTDLKRYLKRIKRSLKAFCESHGIESYQSLLLACQNFKMEPPEEEYYNSIMNIKPKKPRVDGVNENKDISKQKEVQKKKQTRKRRKTSKA